MEPPPAEEPSEPSHLTDGPEAGVPAPEGQASNSCDRDATIDVRYGEQTWDEMMFGWYSTAVPRKNAGTVD